MPRLLAYIRRSIYDTDDPTASPARQRAACERIAAGLGAKLEFYEDLDYSGKNENRPGWQALIGRLDNPDVIGVCVESIDRSHRSVRDFFNFYDFQIAPRGLRLISATQQLDLSTADGRGTASILMTIAEWERSKVSERMAATVHHIQTVNRRHFGPLPFATARDSEKHLIPSTKYYWLDPQTGATWRGDDLPVPRLAEQRFYYDALTALATLHSDGQHSYNDTADALNAGGWRHWASDKETPVLWTRQSVRSVARHWQLYAGELPPSPTTPVKRNRERATVPGGHKPILPVELCQRLGAAYQARSVVRDPGHSNRSEHCYLLTGLLTCAVCGQRLSGQVARRGDRAIYYYRHQYGRPDGCTEAYTPALDLEQQVIGALVQVVSQQEALVQLLDRLRRNLAIQAAENDAGARALLDLDAKRGELERLVELYTTGRITLTQFDQREATLKAEVSRLEAETAASGAAALVDSEVLFEALVAGLGRLGEAPPELQRTIIHGFIDRLTVGGGRVVRCEPATWAARLFACVDFALENSPAQSLHLDIMAWLT